VLASLLNYAYRYIAGTWPGHLVEEKGFLEEKVPETGALTSAKPFLSASSTAAAVT